ARRLGISRDTVRRWLRTGWLNLRRDDDGHHVIWADASGLRRLRELHDLPRTRAHKTRLAKLQKPKPRPPPDADRVPGAGRSGHPTSSFGGIMAGRSSTPSGWASRRRGCWTTRGGTTPG